MNERFEVLQILGISKPWPEHYLKLVNNGKFYNTREEAEKALKELIASSGKAGHFHYFIIDYRSEESGWPMECGKIIKIA